MAVELKNPQFLIDDIKRLTGVDLNPTVTFDAQQPLLKADAQFKGSAMGSDFGAEFGAEDMEWGPGFEDSEFGSFLRHIIGRKADRAVRKGLKKIAPVAALVSFAIPGVGALIGPAALGALAAADKLLGDKNIKNAAKVVSNTKALAALGDPAAKRGALILAAASKVRTVKNVPPGKPAIPFKGKVSFTPYVAKTPAVKVQLLAKAKASPRAKPTVAAAIKRGVVKPKTPQQVAAQKLTLWMRVKQLFTSHPVATVAVKKAA